MKIQTYLKRSGFVNAEIGFVDLKNTTEKFLDFLSSFEVGMNVNSFSKLYETNKIELISKTLSNSKSIFVDTLSGVSGDIARKRAFSLARNIQLSLDKFLTITQDESFKKNIEDFTNIMKRASRISFIMKGCFFFSIIIFILQAYRNSDRIKGAFKGIFSGGVIQTIKNIFYAMIKGIKMLFDDEVGVFLISIFLIGVVCFCYLRFLAGPKIKELQKTFASNSSWLNTFGKQIETNLSEFYNIIAYSMKEDLLPDIRKAA